jgi:hypothetical protein
MGGPCDQLIPAAILYDNPGLSLEEFSSRLYYAVSSINGGELKDYMPFDEYEMGRLLNLRHTRRYRQVLKYYNDKEFNYIIREFHHYYDKYTVHNRRLKDISLDDIIVHTSQIIMNVKGYYDRAYIKGDHILSNDYEEDPPTTLGKDDALQAVEILETTTEQNDPEHNIVKQKIRARALYFECSEEEFPCAEEMARKYPDYHPRKIFEFSQKTGVLHPSERREKNRQFMWKKEEDRYYLDLDFLRANLSPNSLYARDARNHSDGCTGGVHDRWYHKDEAGCYSLSDLVLTCEALRRRQWDVFRYVGFRHDFTDFIYSNEETLRRYEQAVFDSETSVFARKQGWTYTELLMNRALWRATSQEREMPFKDRVMTYKKWKKEHDKEAERLAKEKEAMRKEEKEDEAPF